MAQKVQVLVTDDLDGSEAEGTVRFGLDGASYEIDLSAEHAAELREILAAYVAAGRKTSVAPRRTARGGRVNRADQPDPSEVREWAKNEGHEVSDRGRVPNDLVAKFQAAHV